MNEFENEAYDLGYKVVAGIDEVGRGPLCGPVVTCAVVFSKEINLPGVTDSKKLSPEKRDSLCEDIMSECLDYGIGIASNEEIDKYNIGRATSIAMKRSVCELSMNPDYILVDGNLVIPDLDITQKCIVKGDSLSISIAAASILAKVTRDKIMEEYHYKFPEYNFFKNKGYGTQDHIEALEKYGPCEIHRKSFEPIRSFVQPYKQVLLF